MPRKRINGEDKRLCERWQILSCMNDEKIYEITHAKNCIRRTKKIMIKEHTRTES